MPDIDPAALLAEANAHAQRRFHAMLEAKAFSDAEAPETIAYVLAERTVDDILAEVQWEAAQVTTVPVSNLALSAAGVPQDPRAFHASQEREPDEALVTAVCDLVWEHGVYIRDSTPLAKAIVARLTSTAEEDSST